MTARVFIDGEVGTTGLQIRARLAERAGIELLSLPEDRRKDRDARAEAINAADLIVLCLPDDAAREAVSLIENNRTRVVDASTAHRTDPGWTYGFPELDADQPARIAAAARVANPGCYALTAIALLNPLTGAGLIPRDWPVAINAISGYSGGGKGLIAAFEDARAPDHTDTPFRVYGLTLAHKHTPEIRHWGGLDHYPLFVPSVGKYRQGMIVQIPLPIHALPGAPAPGAIHACLAERYAGRRFVRVIGPDETAGIDRLEPEALNGTNDLEIYVFANEERGQVLLAGVIDNLGKGASGQAVQNINLMLGLDEGAGLDRPAPL